MSLTAAFAERRFELPGRRHPPWWGWAIAIVVHLPLLLIRTEWRLWHEAPAMAPVDVVRSDRQVVMSYLPPPANAAPRSNAAGAAPTSAPVTRGASASVPMARTDTGRGRAPTAVGVSPLPTTPAVRPDAARPRSRQIGPSYGTGQLWVRPLPISPQELAQRLGAKSHDEKVDSAVTAIIQDYLDRLAADETQQPQPLPSWTTQLGGKTVGVDSKWIYLGPIRVPTFLLALIPMNVQANPTQADMTRRLNAMREDLFTAARRSANYADFKAAVGKLREETQRRRDFDKAQRSAPDEPEGT